MKVNGTAVKCGHDKHCQLTVRKLQQCHRCDQRTSLTAGTIFESTKLPLTVWFQGIYLMNQDKKSISAVKLHRHLGISYKYQSTEILRLIYRYGQVGKD